MIPDPGDVAKLLKKTVFKSKKEKLREAQIQRDVQVRTAKTHIQQHIQHQKELMIRYKGLAKKALSLNDEVRFRQAGKQMLASQQDVMRWEKYLLSFEILETRKEQAQASVELVEAVKALSTSLEAVSEPVNMEAIQAQMEKGLAQAANLEERMDVMMGMMDVALEGSSGTAQDELAGLEEALLSEIKAQEAACFDPEMESALAKLRNEIKEK